MSIKVLRLALRINCDWSELNQVWALISLSKPNLLGKEYKEEIYQRKNPNDKKLIDMKAPIKEIIKITGLTKEEIEKL